MRVFCPIVQAFVLAVLHTRQDLTFRRSIALQLIGDDHAWDVLQPFEQFAKKTFRGLLVALALNQDVEHIPILVDSSPQGMGFSMNFEKDFIQVPCVATTRAPPSQCIGVRLPTFQAPLTDRFIRDHNPALCEQFFDITKTERETNIRPHGMADDFRWKAHELRNEIKRGENRITEEK
jgi:hypothetical protein